MTILPARSVTEVFTSAGRVLPRIAVSALGALLLAVLLGWAGLALSRIPVALIDEPSGQVSFLLALAPAVALAAAGTVGALLATAAVAVLVRDQLAGVVPGLGAAWARSWRALPALVVVGGLALVVAWAAARLWVPVSVLVLGGALVRWRLAGRPAAGRVGWLVVPFALPLAVLVAVPVVWAAVLSGMPLREAVRRSAAQRLLPRLAVLAGLVLALGLGWLLGMWGRALLADPGADLGRRGLGVLGMLLCTALALAAAGALLGLLGHRRGEAPTALEDRGVVLPRVQGRGRWAAARLASVAWVSIGALVAPLTPGLVVVAAGAIAVVAPALPSSAEPGVDGGLVVTTLADTAPVAGECVDDGASCGLRAAVALAGQRGGGVVDFDVTGTIALTETLVLTPGIVLDARYDDVVLDAQGAGRAVLVQGDPEAEGGRIVLRGLTVRGGRTVDGGAGLRSDGLSVALEHMTFVDNVTTAGDGGAVAARGVHVESSTFLDNSAPTGSGGAVAAGQVIMVNSTLVGNEGSAPAGGSVLGDGELAHVTVVGGGGVAGAVDGSGLSVVNSAVSTTGDRDACARLSDQGLVDGSTGNVDPIGTCGGAAGAPGPFAPLGSYDGALTQVLVPAADAGVIGAATSERCEYADQRGAPRVASACDAGAVQVSVEPVLDLDLTLTSAPEVVRPGSAVDLTVRVSPETPVDGATVEFFEGPTSLGAPERLGHEMSATLRVLDFSQGPHEVHAVVTADGSSRPVTSGTLKVLVRQQVVPQVSTPSPTLLRAPTTFTATIIVDDEPGVPLPTGTMRFENGGVTHEAEVVDGVAVWQVDELPASFVRLTYLGDDYHENSRWEHYVVTEDRPTTTTVSVVDTTVRLGEPVVVDVESRGVSWPAEGTVEIRYDGRLVSARLTDGLARLAVPLSAGSHAIAATLRPDAGWAASSSDPVTVDVDAAAVSVVLTAPTLRAYDDAAFGVSAQVTGAGRAGATVRLLDGERVLDTGVSDSEGRVSWYVAYGTLAAGDHDLAAEVVASETVEGGRSAVIRLTVTKAESSISASTTPITWRDTATVVVTSDSGAREGVLVLRDADGAPVATSVMADGRGELTYVPAEPGTLDLRVDLSPTDGNHLDASARLELRVERLDVAEPELTWSADPAPGDTTLSVRFTDDAPVPTGTVVLVDRTTGSELDTATILDGAAELDLPLADACFCNRLDVRYSGDTHHRAGAWTAPDVTLPKFPSTTTLGPLPDAVESGTRLRLVAEVSAGTTVSGQVVFWVNGDDVATARVVDGRAELDHVVPGAGAITFRAEFRPVPGDVSGSTSDTDRVEVHPRPAPVLTLDAPSPLVVGVSRPLNVTAAPGSTQPHPSQFLVRDDAGDVVGQGQWRAGWQDARVDVVPLHAGPSTFTVEFLYADFGGQLYEARSLPLATTVQQFPSLMRLTSLDPATVAGPIRLQLDLTPPAGMRSHAGMLVQLVVDGVPTGEPRWLVPGLLTTSWQVQAMKEATSFAVTTAGDGAAFGPGVAATSVTASRLVPTVSAAPSAVLAYGDAWRAPYEVTGLGGFTAPTGEVLVLVNDAQGEEVARCYAPVSAGTCEFFPRNVAPGTYSTSLHYWGDERYLPVVVQVRGTLTVLEKDSTIRTTTPQGERWLVGTTRSIAWTVTDPLTRGAAPSGRVLVQVRAPGQPARTLCEVPATQGTCSFPVGATELSLDEQRERRIVATYTPESGARSSYDDSPHPVTPRCLTAVGQAITTVGNDRVAPPTIEGEACQVGTLRGFVEGTDLVVEAAEAPANYVVTGIWVVRPGEGQDVVPGDRLELRIMRSLQFVTRTEWAPDCVMLLTGTEHGLRPTYGAEYRAWIAQRGRLDILTEPNCTHPLRATKTETDRLNIEGWGLYARGTRVEMVARAAYANRLPGGGEDPSGYEYEPVGVIGAEPVPGTTPGLHATVLEKDQTDLRPQFRMTTAMCNPLPLRAGEGGEIRVRSASVPDGPAHLYEDQYGRCRQESGEPGFLKGTRLDLNAVGARGNFFHQWHDGQQQSVPLIGVGTLPVSGQRSAVAGVSGLSTAGFAFVDCVSLDYDFWVPLEESTKLPYFSGASPDRQGMAAVDAFIGGSTCAARTSTQTDVWPKEDSEGRYLHRSGKRWFVRGTYREISVPSHTSFAAAEVTLTGEPTITNPTAATIAVPGFYTANAQLDVTYRNRGCIRPAVTSRPSRYPFSYGPTRDERCPDGLFIGGGVHSVFAGGVDQAREDGLSPYISVTASPEKLDEMFPANLRTADHKVVDSGRGRHTLWIQSSQLQWEGWSSGADVRINYCGRLDVDLRFEKADGSWLNVWDMGSHQLPTSPTRVLTDGDACPAPLMALPGATTQIGLSAAGATAWKLVRSEVGTRVLPTGERPQASLAADGTTSDKVLITVRPRCFSLSTPSEVEVTIDPNCPGEPGRYLAGTQVGMFVQEYALDRFSTWYDVAASSGHQAVVIMHGDRTVRTDYVEPSTLELIVTVTSNIVQRGIAAVLGFAASIAGTILFVVDALAFLADGLAWVLNETGLGGAFADGLSSAADTMTASTDLVRSLGDCTGEWSNGGGSALGLSSETGQRALDLGVDGTGIGLEALDQAGLAGGLGALSDGLAVADLFLTGPEGFLQDPAEAWSSVGDIGGCIQKKGEDVGSATGL